MGWECSGAHRCRCVSCWLLCIIDGVTLTVQIHAQPCAAGDKRVVVQVLWHKVVLFRGFYSQHVSLCQEEAKTQQQRERWTSVDPRGIPIPPLPSTAHPCPGRSSPPPPCCARWTWGIWRGRRNTGRGAAPTATRLCPEGSDRPPGAPAFWLLVESQTQKAIRAQAPCEMPAVRSHSESRWWRWCCSKWLHQLESCSWFVSRLHRELWTHRWAPVSLW